MTPRQCTLYTTPRLTHGGTVGGPSGVLLTPRTAVYYYVNSQGHLPWALLGISADGGFLVGGMWGPSTIRVPVHVV